MRPCWEAFWSTFAEKYALEKEVFFRSLPRVPFFRFLSLLGGFGGALWKGFCANIDCSLENATSQKAWFYLHRDSHCFDRCSWPRKHQGGEKHACGSNASFRKQKKQLRKLFLTILRSRGEPDFGLFLIKCCFFLNLFFLQFLAVFGEGVGVRGGVPLA